MTLTDCRPCCSTPETVEVPGPQGNSGITTTSASFVIPAIGATVAISVGDTSWMKVGKNLFISDGSKLGNFLVTAIGSSVGLTGEFLGLVSDSAAGSTIASGAVVTPGLGNYLVPVTLDTLAAFTDSTTGTPGSTLAAGVGQTFLSFYILLVDITAADLITTFILGYKFKILSFSAIVDAPATAGGKAATLTPKINGAALTGGVLSLTSANMTPKGNVVNATAVTAGNTGSNSATISITGSAVTPFTEGSCWLMLRVQNMDTADAFASISTNLNSIRTALRHQ